MTEVTEILEQKREVVQRLMKDPLPVMRSILKNDLYKFIQYFWGEYSSDPFVPNWHIEKECRELEYVARRVGDRLPKEHDLLFNVPPGTSKTAVISVFFPLWCWVNWYWMRFITVSYSAALSLETAEYSRDVVRSLRWKRMFPDIDIKPDKDTKSNFRVIKKVWDSAGRVPRVIRGGHRLSTSVGGGGIGFHGDFLIWDDPINPKSDVSKAILDGANHYLDRTLALRKVNKEVTVTIGIMQRLHQDDPSGHWLRKKKANLRHFCLPGTLDGFEHLVQPPELKQYYVNGLLDPVRMSQKVLEDVRKDLGDYGYAGQIGQNPVPPGGGMFKVDNFHIIDYAPAITDIVRTVRYWDKAGSENTGAHTSGVKMSLLKNGKFLIHDRVKGQWAEEMREHTIRHTAEADGTKTLIYHEQEPGSGGKDSAKATTRNLAGFIVEADRPQGDKIYRARPYAVQVNDGNVLLLRGEWNDDFIDEHRFFPYSKYKDQVDSASGAFTKLTNKRKGKSW